MVICLERGEDLHMVQLMPLPLTVSCFRKTQIGFTFLVPAHPGKPGKGAVKRVCVCVCVVEKINDSINVAGVFVAHVDPAPAVPKTGSPAPLQLAAASLLQRSAVNKIKLSLRPSRGRYHRHSCLQTVDRM